MRVLLSCLCLLALCSPVPSEQESAYDECAAGVDGHCSLSALQLRSSQIRAEHGTARSSADLCVDNEQEVEASNAVLQGTKSCDEMFPNEARVFRRYMHNTSNRILVFGWLYCPCVTVAQVRLAEANLCYVGRLWQDSKSTLMRYLQCKAGDANAHSFVYFRKQGSRGLDKNSRDPHSWVYAGTGFDLNDSAMSQQDLLKKADAANASTTCHVPDVKVNIYGTKLKACRTDESDSSGSWQKDGTCSELAGDSLQICVEDLPANFFEATHDLKPWSRKHAGSHRCVSIGALSLYMTNAQKHPGGADAIKFCCKCIPETVFTKEYLGKWYHWRGHHASALSGLHKLVSTCISQESDLSLKCGLKERFMVLQHFSAELNASSDFNGLSGQFGEQAALQASLDGIHCLRHG